MSGLASFETVEAIMTAAHPSVEETATGKGATLRRQRRVLFVLQNGVCAHCGGAMLHPDVFFADGSSQDLDAPTLDHVVTKSRGGANGLHNLLLAHRSCNEARGERRLPRQALLMFQRIAPLIKAIQAGALKSLPADLVGAE